MLQLYERERESRLLLRNNTKLNIIKDGWFCVDLTFIGIGARKKNMPKGRFCLVDRQFNS